MLADDDREILYATVFRAPRTVGLSSSIHTPADVTSREVLEGVAQLAAQAIREISRAGGRPGGVLRETQAAREFQAMLDANLTMCRVNVTVGSEYHDPHHHGG